MERIQKIISASGYCSRRKAEELILQGKVQVNGKIARIGQSADLQKDKITVNGEKISKTQKVYYLFNKPAGFETSFSPRSHKSIFKLVKTKQRVVPVGRLDVDSKGLLILTNDGELANRIMHPKFEIDKIYSVTVNGQVDDSKLEILRKGVILEEGKTSPSKIEIVSRTILQTRLNITLHEGKKRQIRRMLAKVGHGVKDLQRTKIGNLSIKGLEEGKFRELTKNELDGLRKILKIS